MKLHVPIIAILLAASNTSALAQQLDVKGISLGMTRTQLQERFANLQCAPVMPTPPASMCSYVRVGPAPNVTELNSIAEELVIAWHFMFIADELGALSITFPTDSYAVVSRALREKFGPASNVRSVPLQNAMGATFDSSHYTWRRGKEFLVAIERHGRIDRAELLLTTDGFAKLYEAASQKVPSNTRRAKDL
jgi:hypothetical protein